MLKKEEVSNKNTKYEVGMYSLNKSAQAKLRGLIGKEEEPRISLSGVVKDPLNFNPNKLIGAAKLMKGNQSTYTKAGFLLEKELVERILHQTRP